MVYFVVPSAGYLTYNRVSIVEMRTLLLKKDHLLRI